MTPPPPRPPPVVGVCPWTCVHVCVQSNMRMRCADAPPRVAWPGPLHADARMCVSSALCRRHACMRACLQVEGDTGARLFFPSAPRGSGQQQDRSAAAAAVSTSGSGTAGQQRGGSSSMAQKGEITIRAPDKRGVARARLRLELAFNNALVGP